jgi:hypothetical protein
MSTALELFKLLGFGEIAKNLSGIAEATRKAVKTGERQDFSIGEDKYQIDLKGKIYDENGKCVVDLGEIFSGLLAELLAEIENEK